MEENRVKRQLSVDEIHSILKIFIEELNSEKEQIASYREIHFQKATNFRGKIFKSAATAATLLTAILALKSTDLVNKPIVDFVTQYQLGIIIVLGIDIIIVFGAEFWFATHIANNRISWFRLEHVYVSAIDHINNIRKIIATTPLENDMVNDYHQFYILLQYTKASLRLYRKEMVCKMEEVAKNIVGAKDIKTILQYPYNKEKKLQCEAEEIYNSYKDIFKMQLVDLPLAPSPDHVNKPLTTEEDLHGIKKLKLYRVRLARIVKP